MSIRLKTGKPVAIALGAALAFSGSAGALCIQALAPSETAIAPIAQAKSSVKNYTTWTCSSKKEYEQRDKDTMPIASYGKLEKSRLTLTGNMYYSTNSKNAKKLKAKKRTFKVSSKVKYWNSSDHKSMSFSKAKRYVKTGCKLSFNVTGGKVTYISIL